MSTNPSIMVGPYSMRRDTAIGLMVSAISAAAREDRPFDERDFMNLGFTSEQIRTFGPTAWMRAAASDPNINSYFEVSR